MHVNEQHVLHHNGSDETGVITEADSVALV